MGLIRKSDNDFLDLFKEFDNKLVEHKLSKRVLCLDKQKFYVQVMGEQKIKIGLLRTNEFYKALLIEAEWLSKAGMFTPKSEVHILHKQYFDKALEIAKSTGASLFYDTVASVWITKEELFHAINFTTTNVSFYGEFLNNYK